MLLMVGKWILSLVTRVSSQMWFLVAGAFGAFLIYAKGKKDQKKETELEEVQEDLEGLKRLKDVKTNTDVDSALERLQSNGKLRD